MRVAGRDLDFMVYHSLDVLGTFLVAFLVVLGILGFCVVKTWNKCLPIESKKNKQKKKVQ